MAVELAIAFAKTPAVLIDGSQSHDLLSAIKLLLIGDVAYFQPGFRRCQNDTVRSSSASMKRANITSPAFMAINAL